MQVIWKPFASLDVRGKSYVNDALILNEGGKGKHWLNRIQSMPQGRPLDLETAVTIADHAWAHLFNNDPRPVKEKIKEMDWLLANWLDYVIQQGYRIQLRGDEYFSIGRTEK